MNQTFFSSLGESLNAALCFSAGAQAVASEKRRVSLSLLREYLQECEKNFPVLEIEYRKEIDPFCQRNLINALNMIQDILKTIEAQNKLEQTQGEPYERDVIVVDNDAVVIVPREQAQEVYDKTLARENKEAGLLKKIHSGEGTTYNLAGFDAAFSKLGLSEEPD